MGQSLAEMGNEWFQRSANMICIPDTLVTIIWKVSKENLREILIEIKINDGFQRLKIVCHAISWHSQA